MARNRYTVLVLFSLLTALFIVIILRLMPLSARRNAVDPVSGTQSVTKENEELNGEKNDMETTGAQEKADTETIYEPNDKESNPIVKPDDTDKAAVSNNVSQEPSAPDDIITADKIADREENENLYYVTEFEGMDKYIIPEKDSTGSSSGTGASSEDSFFSTEFADTLPVPYDSLKNPELPAQSGAQDIKAVWVASVYNLDFPSQSGLSSEKLAAQLDEIVENTLGAGLNTIFFQVRPCADALYKSDVFPSSEYLGNADFDALGYLVRKAHEKGIAVHAWVNPYRVTVSASAHSDAAEKYSDLIMDVDGRLYFDPGKEGSVALIVRGVAEIVVKYDVDGIVFDDYFYPEGIDDEDSATYSGYVSAGGTDSLKDWRRENVNELIRRTYAAVKQLRPDCLFGVSPRGIWRNSSTDKNGSATSGSQAYDDVYCDALAWINEGCVDYISPQIYWSFENTAAPFKVLCDWWNEQLKGKDISLVVSLAAYYLPESEIEAQKSYLGTLTSYGGFALYSYSSVS